MQSVKMVFLGSYSIIVSSLVLIGAPLVMGLELRSNLGSPISKSNIHSPFRSASGAKAKALMLNQNMRRVMFLAESSYKITGMIIGCATISSIAAEEIEEIEENLNRILSQVATTAENVAESLDGGSIDKKILELFIDVINDIMMLDGNTIPLLETDRKALDKDAASLGRQEKELSRMVREVMNGIQQYEKLVSSGLTTEARRIAGAMRIIGDIEMSTSLIYNSYGPESISIQKTVLSDFEKIFEDLLNFLQVVMSQSHYR